MSEERQKIKCSDCGVEDEQTWFERSPEYTDENPVLIQHGLSFSKCHICDYYICEDCYTEHAEIEAFG